jgi:Icc protein
VIGLDTLMPGDDGGEVCAEREAWLESRLAEGGGRPTIILMHHPPFPTGVPAMDPMMCRTRPSFRALIGRHPEIERILAGHFHRPIAVRYAGTIGFVGPGTAHQVVLDLRAGQPNRFNHEPPGLALHSYRPDTGMVSHLVPVGEFGPARDF